MTDEEMIQRNYPPNLYPWLYPDLFPDYATPEPTTEPALDSTALTTPPPESSSQPVEVVTVEELLDWLAQNAAQPDGSAVLGLPEEAAGSDEMLADVPVVPDPDPVSLVVEQVVGKLVDVIADLGRIEQHTESMDRTLTRIDQTLDHPALTTSFADYTVTEALLLLLLLAAFLAACARMLRGGFSWLRS